MRQKLGRHRAPELALAVESAEPGTWAIDVGASVGIFALALSRAVGSQGAVLALEPNPVVFEELRRSTWGTSVIPLCLGASDRSQWVSFEVPRGPGGHAASPLGHVVENRDSNEGAFEVHVVRIDDLQPPDKRVSIVKIDVEGHESSVLRGCDEVIARNRPVFVIEIEDRHLNGQSVRDVVEILRGKDYDAFAIDGTTLLPFDRFDVDEHQRSRLLSTGAPAPGYVNNFIFRPVERLAVGSY
jgi:FkbM family methyltransferase